MKNQDFKVHGYFGLSNYGGLEVMLNDSNDAIIYRWYGKVARRWQEIKYTRRGDAYFVRHGRRYYLKDFMRA